MGIHWQDYVTNDEVLGGTQVLKGVSQSSNVLQRSDLPLPHLLKNRISHQRACRPQLELSSH